MTFDEKYKQIMKMSEEELTKEDINELIDLVSDRLEFYAVEQIQKILIHQKLKNINVVDKNIYL
jgi:hypothetical protein